MRRLAKWRPQDSRFFPNSFLKRVFQEGEGHRNTDALTGSTPLSNYHNRLPTFWVRSDAIKILSTPQEFYDELLHQAGNATQRVSLASLYLGTGPLEQKFLNTLANNYCQQEHLKVRVVMDRNRGTRCELPKDKDKDNTTHGNTTHGNTTHGNKQGHSAATLFKSVISTMRATANRHNLSEFRVGLFSMPLKENDWFARFFLPRLPPRYNELLTTFHLKAYVFDDTLIMSGANLSNDYFTSRQDRYWVIQNAPLATLYHSMINILYVESQDIHEKEKKIVENYDTMKEQLQVLMRKKRTSEWSTFGDTAYEQTQERSPSKQWACIRPSIQCAALGLRHDEIMTKGLMARLDDMGEDRLHHGYGMYDEIKPPTVHVSTGYLNFHYDYKDLLLKMRTNIKILAASPSANGFYTAFGISSSLPVAYSLIAQRLYNEAQKYAQSHHAHKSFSLYEYDRDQWTYHAKGLWFTEEQEKRRQEVDRTDWYKPDDEHFKKDDWYGIRESSEDSLVDRSGKDGDKSENDGIDGTSGGSLTLVGSPNFGYRSVERDFESSLLIVTEDFELRKRMETELQQLMAYTSHVNATTFKQPERKLRGLFNWSQGWWISIASRFVKPFM